MEIRVIVGAYLIIFFAFMTFLIGRAWAKIGMSPIVLHKSAENSLMAFAERAAFLSYSLLILSAVFYVFDFAPFFLFDEFPLPNKREMRIIGVFLAGVALILIFTATFQMSDSWRMGIDDRNDAKTAMVSCGLFRFFRHPIYLFAIVLGVSIFLVDPHSVSLMALAVYYVSLSVQSRIEENFLLHKWGECYKDFMRSRSRWF